MCRGIEDGLLEVNLAVAERPLRLALRGFQRRLQLLRGVHQAHAFAATTCRRFQHHGIADLRGDIPGLLHRLQGPGSTGHKRHTGLLHLLAGAGL